MELRGRTILITRAPSQSSGLREGLENLGASVLECPLLEIAPIDDWAHVDQAIANLATYDWLLFTSTNAVDLFLQRIEGKGISCHTPVAAVGSATADRVRRWGLVASLVPDSFRAEGLLATFPQDMAGKRVLLPRAETARELLPEELRRRGATVDVVPVYRTIKSEAGLQSLRPTLLKDKIDCLVLTSPSAVNFLAEALGDDMARLLDDVAVAVIGPVAMEAARSAGLEPGFQPHQATVPALIEAIRTYFRAERNSGTEA